MIASAWFRVIGTTFLFGTGFLFAQSDPGARARIEVPAELAAAQQTFAKEIRERLTPLHQSYATALGKVERELAAAGDFSAAIAARDERRKIERILSTRAHEEPRRPAPAAGVVVLAGRSSDSSGGAAVGADRASLAGASPSLTWSLQHPLEGEFDVAITYRCSGVAKFSVQGGSARLRGQVA